MEYPLPVYLIMLQLFAGYISPDEAVEMIDLRLHKEQESNDGKDILR